MATLESVEGFQSRLEKRAFAPLTRSGKGFYALVGLLLVLIGWGAVAYVLQLRDGLYVTGMRDRMLWGVYISLFVFFIGASMGGTFISAILRVTNAPWRLPVVRSAELVTVAALLMAGLFISFDVGRPDRIPNLILFGHWTSPLAWDMYGLTTYLVGSMIYLYMALIPDLALCRDRLRTRVGRPMLWFLDNFAIGWRGSEGQRASLGTGLKVMAILIIPVAVMMHTVTSWVFAMTLREPWNSPLFGIYFVGGAVYSGVGIIIIMAAILRRVYHLEEFITPSHFRRLGFILAAFAAIMLFFNLSEYVTHAYKLQGQAAFHIEHIFTGDLAPLFWTYLAGGLVVPMVMMMLPLNSRVLWVVAGGVLANIGMLIERYVIVAGGLQIPLNPYEPPQYTPTWVEWSLATAGFAGFVLIITLALKLIPGVPVSEMSEAHRRQNGAPAVH